ncbi:MAG: hypothetical protein Q7S58_21380 [Candidatus Binatus sp.]|uniref:hypothetical protein n=1 Tax=Candidatus Binatus sp. TaxID=2811406 RepID=UPI00272571A1|nr:hypothetical protein [Candidatus Binatus sp.]MDO8434959.1 hypothetical protein [Candidatus Binatus sp.]
MRNAVASTLALAIAAALSAPAKSVADTVPTQTLRNVAGIVSHGNGRVVQVGTAFFVAVPSEAFPGRSFVYLVTARHNLLDQQGNERSGLFLTLEDSKTAAMREEPLPPEAKWVLDPLNEKADVAAVPFTSEGAAIAPIPLSSLLGNDDPLTRPETGAQIYYLTAATVGASRPRFEALARFGHVSVPVPAETEVVGAGLQQLSLLDGGGTPGFSSGAPVFVSAGLRFALWGILEANSSLTSDPVFSGLAGVLPARYIVETVKAMAEVQDKALRGTKAPD